MKNSLKGSSISPVEGNIYYYTTILRRVKALPLSLKPISTLESTDGRQQTDMYVNNNIIIKIGFFMSN